MTTRMGLRFVFLSLVLSWARRGAMAEGSVQYKPGNARPDNLHYCPAAPASGQSISYAPQGALITKIAKVKDEAYNNAWSGTRKDLEAIVNKAENAYGKFEGSKHLGRNATMLVPATLEEMGKEIALFGNPHGWGIEESDKFHQPSGQDRPNVKYTTLKGDRNKNTNQQKGYEVVYNKVTGKIVTDKYMGTKNYEPLYKWNLNPFSHYRKDMRPHWFKNQFEKDGDQYKYVGILYERDPSNPDKFYIIDGQTGLPMTPQQVSEMPTTLSDMWKSMGLVCVKNDAMDMAEPDQCRGEGKSVIDTSALEACYAKLDRLLDEFIKSAERILASGQGRLSKHQIEELNESREEIVKVCLEAVRELYTLDCSEEERIRIDRELGASVMKKTRRMLDLLEEFKKKGWLTASDIPNIWDAAEATKAAEAGARAREEARAKKGNRGLR